MRFLLFAVTTRRSLLRPRGRRHHPNEMISGASEAADEHADHGHEVELADEHLEHGQRVAELASRP